MPAGGSAGASAHANSQSLPDCPSDWQSSNAYANAWSQAQSDNMGFANADAFASAINDTPSGDWMPGQNCQASGSANAQASANT